MNDAAGVTTTRRKSQSSTHSTRSHFRARTPFQRRSSDSGGSSSEYDPTDSVPHIAKSLDKTLRGDAFKGEILSLLHKLGVVQWRSVPVEVANVIIARKVYGALTNSIYQIALPDDIEQHSDLKGLVPRAAPKLLLRLYGAHAEHLIDRTHELAMLKRLARHNIGPLLLGTFANGRFEQWLDSHTLSRLELRDPNLSCSIARRMRELHDGVKLTHTERRSPPAVWTCLDKWLPRAREIIAQRQRKLTGRLSDKNLPTLAKLKETKNSSVTCDSWSNDLILSHKWASFEIALGRFRLYMEEQYPPQKLKHDLAFCHNDVYPLSLLTWLIDLDVGSIRKYFKN
jgi:choline kinase